AAVYLWCNPGSSARHYYRLPAIIIDCPPLLSIARHYYRSPATIIDRPPLLSIVRHYYRSSATEFDRGATPIKPTTY
ncbi:hypothetical protein, partial [Microcoleus sp. D3_18_C4]|uniref:hypothetical protein n=1 Tax=Microcoleus sp. D3_18_C4 TaxID=3055335 RepID=UPI002FD635AA